MVDFSVPFWLIYYLHGIGTISLLFDAFSVYLVMFKSSQIDNFRFFLLNFQIACSVTDFHITFLMQPVPLYPLMGGYALGFLPMKFGVSLHSCLTAVVFLYIYQVASMIVCFVRKNQSIAGTLTSFAIPALLIIFLVGFLAVYTFSVVGMYFCSGITENEKMKFVEENLPEYLSSFQSLPNFSIYQANALLFIMVITAVIGGLLAFSFFMAVLYNIFRMLSFMKVQMSDTTYKRHRAAVWSLIAQFATSIICFLPPISLVFVVFLKLPNPQVIVELLLVVACLHSPANVTVLMFTFPPYRKFVCVTIFRQKPTGLEPISAKSSVMVSHLAK
ncbi:Serpentine Receptor, class I [Caenorhabditis elegans]|uniref:Serpentine Receptor, class I n=1 Tax=Caenorhabditis elegans TaxID=6239 RepID=O16718_CAEEL|nr:Serpentine Receptor, class I [Caenorhabditis elegans]CCD68459.1 Serpentine Receptor, class I [Caenorhabditis elegans]|eukprot:NP_494328.2 Serpentine Receptor, class I [Caenorhabditis elegans]